MRWRAISAARRAYRHSDERILAIYNALRPFRSSQAELLAIADELEHTWHATVNAAFVRESAEVYQQRHKLRKGS